MAGLFKKVSGLVAGALPYNTMNAPEEAWREAARQLGLTFTPGATIGHPMIVAGQLRGVIIEAQPYNEVLGGGGRSVTEYFTRFAADFPSAAPPIRLETRGFSAIFQGSWSKRPATLEGRVKVARGQDDALARFLTPARRDAVWALEEEFAPVTLTERSFVGSYREVVSDAATLVSALNRVVDLVLVIGSSDTIDLRTPPPTAATPPAPPVPPAPPGRRTPPG